MAVYTSYEIKPQYYTGAVAGCINGGEDYRTVKGKETVQDINLMVNPQMSGLSNACTITNFKMSCQYRLTNTSNGSGLTLRGGFYWYPSFVENPTISGTSLAIGSNNLDPAGNVTFLVDSILIINSERRGDTAYSSFNYEVQPSISNLNGKNVLIGAHFAFKSLNSTVTCRMWLKNVTFTITRTRACYVYWDTGVDGVGTVQTKHDYGTTPTYSGGLSKPGYVFKGWKASNGTIYTGSLPIAGETDVTYTAVWELDKIYVTYDSIFNFRKWVDTNLVSWTLMNISNVTETGFTGTAIGDNDAFTQESRPLIPVEIGREYILEADVETTAGFQLFAFFCNADGVWGNFAYCVNEKKLTFTPTTSWISIRCDIDGIGNVATFSNFRIYPSDCPYMSNTLSAAERTDFRNWSMPTPTRNGYKFLGWYTQPNGGGTKYTSSSGFPTSDLVLYSHWELQKYTINTSATNGDVSGGGIYEYGTPITLIASPADGYKFEKWSDGNTQNPRVITVTGDATYEAHFRQLVLKFKTVKIYYPSENDIASPTNPLVSGEKAQIVVKVALE